jgi:hypothetical protein
MAVMIPYWWIIMSYLFCNSPLAIFTGVAMGLLEAQRMAKEAKNQALPDWNKYSLSE